MENLNSFLQLRKRTKMFKVLRSIITVQIIIQLIFYLCCGVYFLLIEKNTSEIFVEGRVEYNYEYVFRPTIVKSCLLYTCSLLMLVAALIIINKKRQIFFLLGIIINLSSLCLFYEAGKFVSVNISSASLRNYFPLMGNRFRQQQFYSNAEDLTTQIKKLELLLSDNEKNPNSGIPDSLVLQVQSAGLYKVLFVLGQPKLTVFDPFNNIKGLSNRN